MFYCGAAILNRFDGGSHPQIFRQLPLDGVGLECLCRRLCVGPFPLCLRLKFFPDVSFRFQIEAVENNGEVC